LDGASYLRSLRLSKSEFYFPVSLNDPRRVPGIAMIHRPALDTASVL